MLQTLKSMATRYNDYMTYIGRKRACEVLLRSNDRLLEDAGFSRELLKKGADAWPWQVTDPDSELQAVMFDKLPIGSAVPEPQSCKEQVPHDTAITTGTITESVASARESNECEEERKVA